MKRGVISIGTNSTRALVAALDGAPQIVLTRSIGTRIGEGLKEQGVLEEEAMRRTLDALREHAQAVRTLTQDVVAIATSALRRAKNASDFKTQVEAIAGAPLQIISGEEEARRSFIGAVSGIETDDTDLLAVVDTGGGSTEYATGTRRGPETILSCEIGAVRLTEAIPELSGQDGRVSADAVARARAMAFEATQPVAECSKTAQIILVGGTATTSVALRRGTRDFFSYASITRTELRDLAETLRCTRLTDRKELPGMNPQRADILLAGIIILDVMCERTRHEEALVSTNDLLLGTLLVGEFERCGSAGRRTDPHG